MAGFALLFLTGCSSLSGRPEKIEATILKQTRIGCSSAHVHQVIKQHHWTITNESPDHGFIKHGEDKASSIEVGNSSVTCELGYNFVNDFPFKTTVFANWGFDRQGRLIEVWIDKETNGY